MKRLPTNPDVIVVGAGAAGLSAAKALQGRGFEVLVLEADDHVGGRCITDTSAFSTPFDRGGSWMHCAPINPLARLAEQAGDKLHKAPWDVTWAYADGQSLTEAEVAEYSLYQDQMWDEINKAGQGQKDVTVEAALPASRWKDTAKQWTTQMHAADADVTSAADVSRFEDAEGDWLVEGGLGAFIKRHHGDVAVRLNCPVTRIDYSGAGVLVETHQGTVSAGHVVVTVSTGVLAAENIQFHPALPAAKRSALEQLPMGLLNKVGFEFDPAWAGAHQGQLLDYGTGGDEFCTILFGFYETPLAVGFLAGRFADQVEAEGEGAASDYCLGALRDLFGADIDKSIRISSETAWRGCQHALGSYSYALPHGAGAREVLGQSIDEKIFFAGEATIPSAYATVHGAYQSGLKVAADIAAIAG